FDANPNREPEPRTRTRIPNSEFRIPNSESRIPNPESRIPNPESRQGSLMAVTRADKEAELQQLEAAFRGSDSAILVDYKGMNVPQVTELRRQLRTAKAKYKVVKNTIAKRALKGTSFEPLEKFFEGTTAIAFTSTDPVALAKTLTAFGKTAPTLQI